MKKSSITTTGLMLGLMLMSPITNLHAAELKILVGGAMTDIFKELAPQFERASGHKLTIFFGTTPNLIKEATSGQPFDAGVVPVDVMKNASARERFAAGSTTDIARVGFGVIVRNGAAKPNMDTPEAFKEAMLKAQSIAFIPESAAGAHILRVFDRLGISEAMKAKTKTQTAPAQIAQAVAKGDAELGLFLVNVLIAPGVELAASFPGELQQDLVFTSAISANTKEAGAAKALIDYLQTPAAAATIKAKGMKPG
jgi:molybdate transport system substrate-binding protein